MPRVATVPGISCSAVKALSIASASTDSRATQKSLGSIVTRQEGDLAATDSTAAAVDIDVDTPRPEMNRLAGCVNHKALDQTLRSSSRALTNTLAGDAILLARSDAWRRNPLFTMAACCEFSVQFEPPASRSDRSSLATTMQQRACEPHTLTFIIAPHRRRSAIRPYPRVPGAWWSPPSQPPARPAASQWCPHLPELPQRLPPRRKLPQIPRDLQ